MGATERTKGNVAEIAVVNALKARGVNAITGRNMRGGYQTGCDVISDLPISIEVKNHKKTDLAGWLDQAREQADDCKGAVVHKRPRKTDAGDWYLTMTLADFVELVAELSAAPISDDTVPF